ncbi:MAG: hypothetical protein ABIL58_25785 [Pseudomonadota bacterium]
MTGFTERDVEDIQVKYNAEHSPASSNRYLFVIKQVFKRALKMGAVHSNPASDIGYLSELKHRRNRFLLPEMLNTLVECSQKTKARHYMPLLIYLGAEHGASRQEALSLRWQDITFDFEEGLITFFRTKNGVERTEFLMPRTRQALLEWKAHLDAVRGRYHAMPISWLILNLTPAVNFKADPLALL